jgi:acyl-CoA synthetase (NDP forming)
VKAAKKIGYPVVMKIVSSEISHKTDMGGVQLNLGSDAHVRTTYKEMMAGIKKKAPKAKVEGVAIQPMVGRGRELILGAKQDPNFGPVVITGLGGIFVEVLKDSSMRICPFDHVEAHEMLTELKGYPILAGVRGRKPYDIKCVEDALLKLCRLISAFPEIKEIDINPFLVMEKGKGGFALDARIIL